MSPEAAGYSIRFTSDARRDVVSLDGSVQKQLRKILERKLAARPSDYGAPLVGPLQGYWSLHFASHRIIYRVYEPEKVVVVCAVGARRGAHRRDVYERLEAVVEAGRLAQQVLEALQPLPPKKRK